MLSTETIRSIVHNYTSAIGRAGLNALFPAEFDYYLMAFELVDSTGKTIDLLILPILPENYSQVENQYTNIKKTAGGFAVLTTDNFTPKDITLSGSFGRKLRILTGTLLPNSNFLKYSTEVGVFSNTDAKDNSFGGKVKKAVLSARIKTGYGTLKILQSICDKANLLDNYGFPMKLYFYNASLGESYLVKINELILSQNQNDSNMMWKYNLKMTAIAPLDAIKDSATIKGRLSVLMGLGLLQKGLTDSITFLRRQISI